MSSRPCRRLGVAIGARMPCRQRGVAIGARTAELCAAITTTLALVPVGAVPGAAAVPGVAAGRSWVAAVTRVAAVPGAVRAGAEGASLPSQAGSSGASLEAAASKAGSVGRKVAMSLIALGFAIAAVMLVFRRDFKEAAGVFALGLLAILLASPAGVNVLHATVNTLFGSS